MAPCESEDKYQHCFYQWTYNTCLYVLLLKDILVNVELPADLTVLPRGVHLEELVNLLKFYANI